MRDVIFNNEHIGGGVFDEGDGAERGNEYVEGSHSNQMRCGVGDVNRPPGMGDVNRNWVSKRKPCARRGRRRGKRLAAAVR